MATVRKFRNNWVADYTDQWRRRHREKPEGVFDNMAQQKRAANALLERRLDEVDRGSYDPNAKKLTFGEVTNAYLESKINLRATTLRNYKSLIFLYLVPVFGDQKIHQISSIDIERFRNALMEGRPPPVVDAFAERARLARPGLSEARAKQRASKKKPGIRTINKNLTLLVMIMNHAMRHRWIDFNPAKFVEKIKPPVNLDANPIDGNILAPHEISRLIEAAGVPRRDSSGQLIGNNTQLLIKTAVFTGMRSGELRGLQWGDVDWNNKRIHIRRAWKEGRFYEPKTPASNRRIDLPQSIIAELKKWRMACPKGEHDLVFPNLNGKPLGGENLLRRQFYPALRRAGLRKIRFHDLRHTFASLLIANGEDIVRVSRLLGHASPNITLNVYSHMLPTEHYGSAERLFEKVYVLQEAKKENR